MSQFIESISIKEGEVYNLQGHQCRVNKTFEAFAASENAIILKTIVDLIVVPQIGWHKLRITYDLFGNYHFELLAYQMKLISKFELIDIQGKSYKYKYANRDWIDEAIKQSDKDEIIMHDSGLIKDSSYANLVFYNKNGWFTPLAPLLEGTQRAKLIAEGIIQPKPIYLDDLANYTKFKCINAMMNWEDTNEYNISLIG